jgi:hypothetical protein
MTAPGHWRTAWRIVLGQRWSMRMRNSSRSELTWSGRIYRLSGAANIGKLFKMRFICAAIFRFVRLFTPGKHSLNYCQFIKRFVSRDSLVWIYFYKSTCSLGAYIERAACEIFKFLPDFICFSFIRDSLWKLVCFISWLCSIKNWYFCFYS